MISRIYGYRTECHSPFKSTLALNDRTDVTAGGTHRELYPIITHVDSFILVGF
jgi:hypothetical protein